MTASATHMMTLGHYAHPVVLGGGHSVLIRAIQPDDKQRLIDGFHRLTRQSVYSRFFSVRHELSAEELKRFTELDFVHHVALAATVLSEGEERIIGVGRCVELKESVPVRSAEIALVVDDEHQNMGIGTVLFEHIVSIAQNLGITRLEADVLLDNKPMLAILRHSGFKLATEKRDGILHIALQIG